MREYVCMSSRAVACGKMSSGFPPHASYEASASIGRILFPPAKIEYLIALLRTEGEDGVSKYDFR